MRGEYLEYNKKEEKEILWVQNTWEKIQLSFQQRILVHKQILKVSL